MIKKTNKLRTWSILLAALLYSNPLNAEELLISAAMSLKNIFEEIAPLYEQQVPDVTLRYNFGSSGTLEKQIEAGAPADVFASASQRFMDMLEERDDILASSRRDFAQNCMVLVVPADNPAKLAAFSNLKNKSCRNVAIGNPGSVPAGRYAAEVLQHMSLYKSIQKKLVYGEHVRQVLDYVARGEVDAGIVYGTDARIRSKEIRVISDAPPESHTRIYYPAAVVSSSRFKKKAAHFVKFICENSQVQKRLQAHGFNLIQTVP